MGQAKLRREHEKAAALAELADWTRSPTAEEALLADDIDRLPTVIVHRLPAAALDRLGMQFKECYMNCQLYEDIHSKGQFTAIRGWWKKPHGVYMLHSVVQQGEHYSCVTPGAPPDEYQFVPDPEILLTRGKSWLLRRRGEQPPNIVRQDPLRTIKQYTLIVQRINAGMDPITAGDIDWSAA